MYISYHPDVNRGHWHYNANFIAVDVDFFRVEKAIKTHAWSNNVWDMGRRKEANWQFSDFCVFDFDDGIMTLENAIDNYFCDYQHIIGTTKSHQKQKGTSPPCDRFRVVIPWEQRIKDINKYRYNMRFYSQEFPSDKACKDGARYFAPCKQIVSTNFDDDGFRMEVKRYTKKQREIEKEWKAYNRERAYQRILEILNSGISENRNTTHYILGCCADELGMSLNQIQQMIRDTKALKNFEKLRPGELDRALRNGLKSETPCEQKANESYS